MKTKRILLAFFVTVLLLGSTQAQEAPSVSERNVAVDERTVESSENAILHEVSIIRGLQEDMRVNNCDDHKNMKNIAENTKPNWPLDGWNLFGIATFFVASASLYYGIITYRSQKKTEEHTSNAPKTVQLWKLRDLPRHFYRNLVCTTAIIYKNNREYKDTVRLRYPSESNLKKLETLPDDIVLPIDMDKNTDAESNYYKYMHELKLLLRNYNVEVEVASEHLSRRNITTDSLLQDYNNLLFKPLYLTCRTFDFEKALNKSDESLVVRTIVILLKEHFAKLKDESNFGNLLEDDGMACLESLRDKGFDHIDRENCIGRSVRGLMSYGKKKEPVVSAIAYKKENGEASIKSSEILTHVRSGQEKDAIAFITAITQISELQQFYDFFRDYYNNHQNLTDEQRTRLSRLYALMTPYLNYMHCSQWDLIDLLHLILTIDAAIETKRIGMVNF